jgi:hypothetical protein
MSDEATGSRPPSGPTSLDRELAELKEAFPGWHIWYVTGFDGRQRTYQWCAQRLPLLTEDTAMALAAAMAAVDGRDARDMIGVFSTTVAARSGRDRLRILDRLKAELLAAVTGWNVIYRPHANGSVEWEAYRLPLLQADSPEHLAEEMLEVDERYSAGPHEADEPEPVRRIRPS